MSPLGPPPPHAPPLGGTKATLSSPQDQCFPCSDKGLQTSLGPRVRRYWVSKKPKVSRIKNVFVHILGCSSSFLYKQGQQQKGQGLFSPSAFLWKVGMLRDLVPAPADLCPVYSPKNLFLNSCCVMSQNLSQVCCMTRSIN